MTRHPFVYVLFFCLLIGCTWTFAQDSLTLKKNEKDDKKDRCGAYKMRVITPSNEIDYKLQVIKPREDIDFKLQVIDPCKKQEREAVMTPIPLKKENQK